MNHHYRYTAIKLSALLVMLGMSIFLAATNPFSTASMSGFPTSDPPLVSDTVLYGCQDIEVDLLAYFLLLDAGYEGTDSTVVTYHISDSLAQAGGDSLSEATLAGDYEAMDSTVIYIRVTNINDSCFSVGELLLLARPRPGYLITENDACDGDSILVVLDGQAPYLLQSNNSSFMSSTDSVYLKASSTVSETSTFVLNSFTDNLGCGVMVEQTFLFHQNPTFEILDSVVCAGSPFSIAVDAVDEYQFYSNNEQVNNVYVEDTLALIVSSPVSEYVVIDSIASASTLACGTSMADSVFIRPLPGYAITETNICEGDSILVMLEGQAPFSVNTSIGLLPVDTDSLYLLATEEVMDTLILTLYSIADSFGCEVMDEQLVSFHKNPSFVILDSVVCADSPFSITVDAVDEYQLYSDNENVQGNYGVDTLTLMVNSSVSEYVVIDSISSTSILACGTSVADSILIRPLPQLVDTNLHFCLEEYLVDFQELGTLLFPDEAIDLHWSSMSDLSDTLDPSVIIPLAVDDTFWFSAENGFACSLMDSIQVDLTFPPTVDLGVDLEQCVGMGESIPIGGIGLLDPEFTFWEVTSAGLPFGDAVLVDFQELNVSNLNEITEDLDIKLFVRIENYLDCPFSSDTLGLLFHPLPSIESVTSTGCEGDTITVSGIVNAQSLDYTWGQLMENDLQTNGEENFILSSQGAPTDGQLTLVLTSAHECTSSIDSPIQLIAYPEVGIMSFGSGDGDSYCIGEEVVLSAMTESTYYKWILPAEMNSAQTDDSLLTSEALVDSISQYVTLMQSNSLGIGQDELFCSASDSTLISAQRTLCHIDSVYSLPGGIYIVVMSDLEGHENFYQWIGSDGSTLDDDDELLVVLPGDPVPIVIESSHYAADICECNLDFILGGVPPSPPTTLGASPNPATNGMVTLHVPSVFEGKEVVLTLTDPLGRVLQELHWIAQERLKNVILPSAIHGPIILRLRSKDHAISQRLMVE